jgi:hypothetical protein
MMAKLTCLYDSVTGAGEVWNGSAWIPHGIYGGMYAHENAVAKVIGKKDLKNLLFGGIVTGLLNGFTFVAGKALTTVAEATSDAGAKTKLSFVAAHGVLAGQLVSIGNSTNYNGVYKVEQVVDTNPYTFVIAKAFNGAETGAIVVDLAAQLCATYAGVYWAAYQISATPANSNDVFEFELFYGNATEALSTESQVKLGATSDYGSASGIGLMTLAAGDCIALSVENLTGGNNMTNRHVNVVLRKVG